MAQNKELSDLDQALEELFSQDHEEQSSKIKQAAEDRSNPDYDEDMFLRNIQQGTVGSEDLHGDVIDHGSDSKNEAIIGDDSAADDGASHRSFQEGKSDVSAERAEYHTLNHADEGQSSESGRIDNIQTGEQGTPENVFSEVESEPEAVERMTTVIDQEQVVTGLKTPDEEKEIAASQEQTEDDNEESDPPIVIEENEQDSNQAPEFVTPDTGRVNEGGSSLSGQLIASDSDGDVSSLVFSIIDGTPVPPGFSLNSDGSWTFNSDNAAYDYLDAGDIQDVTLSVKVTDEEGASDTSEIKIVVTGTNDAPVAGVDVSNTSVEGAATVFGQLNATDLDADSTMTFTISNGNSSPDGFSLNSDGSYSFDPTHSSYESIAAGDKQIISIPVTVTDDEGETDTSQIQISITGTNDAPVAGANVITSVSEDAAQISGQLTSSDLDTGSSVSYSVTSAPDGFSLNADGSYSFDPSHASYSSLDIGESQVVSIPVTVTDNHGATDTMQLQITVNGVGATAGTVTVANITTDDVVNAVEDDNTIAVSGTATGGDISAGDVVSFTVNGTNYATLVQNDGSWSMDVAGSDLAADTSFDVNVASSNDAGNTVTSSVTSSHTVDSSADAGTVSVANITADDIVNASEDDADITVTGTASGGDISTGDTVSFTVDGTDYSTTVQADGSWSVDVAGSDLAADAGFDVNVVSSDSVGNTVTSTTTSTHIVDTTGTAGTVTIDSISADDVINTAESSATITVTGGANGGDISTGDTVSFTVNGTDYSTTVQANGSWSVDVAGADLNADTSFDVSVVSSDAVGNIVTSNATSTHTVDTVDAIDDVSLQLTADEDTALTINSSDLLANDTDENGDALTSISSVSATADTHGTVSLDSDGNVVFTPEENYNGEASFNYTISDGNGGTDTASVNLTVEDVNDKPVITVTDTTVTEDIAQVIANVSDIDGTIDSSTLSAEHGTVTIDASGDITYTPDADYNGTDSVTINVTDNDEGVTTQTFNVEVKNVQDGPVAIDDTGFEPANATLAGELTFDEGAPTALKGSVTSDSDGMVGNSADFSGAKVSMSGMNLSSEAGAETTVSMWIQGNPEGGWEMLAGSNLYDLVLNNGDIGFNTARGDLFGTDASELADGEWHQIVATFTNGDVSQNSIYIDGQEQDMSQIKGTPSASSANIDSQDGTLFLGSWGANNSYTFTGSMDEVKVFNGSLSSDEVAQLHEIESSNNKWDEFVTNAAEDTATTITAESLLANDTDVDGDTLSITEVTATDDTHGTVSLDSDGNVVFTPEENYNGEASFNYTISDGNGGTDTATVTLNVDSVNDVITQVTDTDNTANIIAEDAANGTEVGVTANAADVDGEAVTFSIVDSDGNEVTDGAFAVDANSGVVTVRDNTLIDFETAQSHDVIVKATSEDGTSSTETFNVGVNDVDESATAGTVTIGTVSGDDVINAAEDDAATIEVSGTASGGDISAGDTVTVTVNGNDYTTIVAGDGSYSVDVNTTDLQADQSIETKVDSSNAAGNTVTSDAASHSVSFDSSATAGSVTVANITTDDVVNAVEDNNTIAVSGTATGGDISEGDVVSFTVNGTNYATLVQSDGSWSMDVAGSDLAADTNFDVSVSSTDAAGNSVTSSTTSTHTVNLDTSASAPTLDMTISEAVISTEPGSSFNDTDSFSGSMDDWSGSGVVQSGNKLEIGKGADDETATKTFSFGAENANQEVTITFDVSNSGGWDSSGSYQDYFKVNVNGSEEHSSSQSYSNDTITITATTDSNGDVAIDLIAETTSSNERITIDNFSISGSSSDVTTHSYDIDFTAALIDTDGSESLSDITLTNLPSGVTLNDSNGDAITANGDGSYTVSATETVTVVSDSEISTPDLNLITSSVTSTESNGGAVATTTVTVNDAVEGAPEITVGDTTAVEDTAQVIANANDLDGTIDSSNLTAENGLLSIADNGDITYTPDAHFSGTDTVNISVTDNNGITSSKSISVEVESVLDAPTPTIEIGAATSHEGVSTGGSLGDWSSSGIELFGFSKNASYLDENGKLDVSQADSDVVYESGKDAIGIYSSGQETESQDWIANQISSDEALAIKLETPVNEATISISRMYSNYDDEGSWQAFDSSGTVISEGTFSGSSNYSSYNEGEMDITISTPSPASYIVFTSPSSGSNDSDFFVKGISYDVDSSTETRELNITGVLSDTDGSEAVSSINISALPSGTSLSAGTENNDGTWTLTGEQVEGLTLISTEPLTEDFDIAFDITVGETSGDETVTVNQTMTVDVDGVSSDAIVTATTYQGGTGDDTFAGSSLSNVDASGGDGDDTFLFNPFDGNEAFHGGQGGDWTDTIQLDASADPGADPNSPWTITVDGEQVEYDLAAHALELSPDSAGVVELSDGSQLTFDGVDKIEW